MTATRDDLAGLVGVEKNVYEDASWRRRISTKPYATAEEAEAARAEVEARFEATPPEERDHHWDERHPDYDPDCLCGWPEAERGKLARMKAVSEATDEYDPEAKNLRSRNRKIERKMALPITDPQRRYLEALAKRVSDPTIVEEIRELLDRKDPVASKAEASRLIERAKTAVEMDDTKPERPERTNRYPGPCSNCGVEVPADEGSLSNVSGRWVVAHYPNCPPKEERIPVTEGLDLSALPSGLYAVPDGDTRLKVRISNLVLDGARNPKWSGYVFVNDGAEYGNRKRYGTQRPGERYSGEIVEALEAILADPLEASKAYGRLTKTCGVCGRRLEDETSVELGIGPICRKRF